MNFIQLGDGLEFDNYLTIANKIGDILLLKHLALVVYTEFYFPFIGDTGLLKLKFQCFLINFFKKSTTQFKCNSFQTTANSICLILI